MNNKKQQLVDKDDVSKIAASSDINNFLRGHNFESLDGWNFMENFEADVQICYCPYGSFGNYGNHILCIETHSDECKGKGIYQFVNMLPEGEYTFSVFACVVVPYTGTKGGIYLRVKDAKGNLLCKSKTFSQTTNQYYRLVSSFKLATAQCVYVEILADGKGVSYVDGAQLEHNPFASQYNMITNGSFENNSAYWITVGGARVAETEELHMGRSLCVGGQRNWPRYAYQDIYVRSERSTRETFTLSGWAKMCGTKGKEPEMDGLPEVSLRAEIHYKDNDCETEVFSTKFSPYINEWQRGSIQFSKSKYRDVDFIRVYCDYSYHCGNAYFDNIQLVRNTIETGLTEESFLKVKKQFGFSKKNKKNF